MVTDRVQIGLIEVNGASNVELLVRFEWLELFVKDLQLVLRDPEAITHVGISAVRSNIELVMWNLLSLVVPIRWPLDVFIVRDQFHVFESPSLVILPLNVDRE